MSNAISLSLSLSLSTTFSSDLKTASSEDCDSLLFRFSLLSSTAPDGASASEHAEACKNYHDPKRVSAREDHQDHVHREAGDDDDHVHREAGDDHENRISAIGPVWWGRGK